MSCFAFAITILPLLAVGILLTVILVPLSFSYVEYYELGLKSRRGWVDVSKVYASGRHIIGPTYSFLKYDADAHLETLDDLSVFSDGGSNESIGLEFKVDVDFSYLLKPDELGQLHQELAKSYKGVLLSRTRDAIKNAAIVVSFQEYFQNRTSVEQRFKEAVRARWDEAPSLHCTLDQFHLGRIKIPSSVAIKQLESRLQIERNDRESYLQQAQLERDMTAVEVNAINLEKSKVLRTAAAEASLLRSKAASAAKKFTQESYYNGTRNLFEAANFEDQEEMTAYTYTRTLLDRHRLSMDVSYISSDNVLRTKAVV